MHPDADRLARLHLFQELSTLGQQLAHTLLLRQGRGGFPPNSCPRTAGSPAIGRFRETNGTNYGKSKTRPGWLWRHQA
jgi:hypothetical protein